MENIKEQQELETLYQAALAELKDSKEQLIVWAGGDAPNQQDTLKEQFSKRFPGIRLEIVVDLSKYHDLRVYQELLDGNLTPDVVMLQTVNDFENWKAMEVLERFKPVSFENLIPGYADPDGAYLGVFMFTFVPQYAKQGLSIVPTTYLDFLRPEFKNKLVLTPPHDDDAVLFVYDHIIKQYGEEFLIKLKGQNPTFIRGTAAPSILVGKEGYLGNLTGYFPMPNDPSLAYLPKDDFFITWAQRGAMFKLTKHKAAARLFLAYLVSYEYQVSRGTWSVRKDVPPPKGLKSLSSYHHTDPLGFITWMRDREYIHKLRIKMEEVFGPVEGESPLSDPKLLKLY